jgi:hypothetical protein
MRTIVPPRRAEAGFNKTTGQRKSKKSPHKMAMPGRNPYQVVRVHGRIKFTRPQRELLALLRDNVPDEGQRSKLTGLYEYLHRNQAYLVNYDARDQANQTYELVASFP